MLGECEYVGGNRDGPTISAMLRAHFRLIGTMRQCSNPLVPFAHVLSLTCLSH